MKTAKVGRNDPCPCGSGQKYKNCCLALEGRRDLNESPFLLYSQLIATVKIKLDQIYTAQIRKLRGSLQEQFLRFAANPYLPREQEALFSDWLWFDVTDSEGISFGIEYLRDHGDFMDEPLRDCLQALNASYLAVYKALGMEADCLRVEDFASGEQSLVLLEAPLEIKSDQPPLLLGRLAALPLGQVFSGIVLMLPENDGQGEFVRRHIDYWRRLNEGQELVTLLKEHAEILFGLFDRANQKSPLDLNHIRVMPVQEKLARLTGELDGSADWNLVHETGEMRWYDLRGSLGEARLGVHREFAVTYADNLDDILRMENNWSPSLRLEDWEMVNSLLLTPALPPEMQKIWYTVIREQETERWLQTPHCELDNKTPREVLEEGQGSEWVLAVLDAFAAQAGGDEYTQDLLEYMRLRVQPRITALQ